MTVRFWISTAMASPGATRAKRRESVARTLSAERVVREKPTSTRTGSTVRRARPCC
jgi:hypothetical protein